MNKTKKARTEIEVQELTCLARVEYEVNRPIIEGDKKRRLKGSDWLYKSEIMEILKEDNGKIEIVIPLNKHYNIRVMLWDSGFKYYFDKVSK